MAPELVFDATLGEVFVARVAGNSVDPAILGSIEYAVEHLHAGLIVVLGHEKCGAVAAAATGGAQPSTNLTDMVSRVAPDVEANVRRQGKALLAGSPILREQVEAGKLRVVLAVYRIETGQVAALEP